MVPKCKCPVLASHEICTFCREVRRLINCKAYKFCLKQFLKVSKSILLLPFNVLKDYRVSPSLLGVGNQVKLRFIWTTLANLITLKKLIFFLFIYDIVIKKISSLITVLLITPQRMYQKTFHGTNAMALWPGMTKSSSVSNF